MVAAGGMPWLRLLPVSVLDFQMAFGRSQGMGVILSRLPWGAFPRRMSFSLSLVFLGWLVFLFQVMNPPTLLTSARNLLCPIAWLEERRRTESQAPPGCLGRDAGRKGHSRVVQRLLGSIPSTSG